MARKRYPRPWCCPEPRCRVLFNDQVEKVPTPGGSFICFGIMPDTIAFTYDGEEHRNDLAHCDYTPLKGIIRWHENIDDWVYVARMFTQAKVEYEGRP